jgi:hypothetical protein
MKNWTNDQLFSAISECAAAAALLDERCKESTDTDRPVLTSMADAIDKISYDARDVLRLRLGMLRDSGFKPREH